MKVPKFSFNWRYAIGEFLIVVIGILVAFQLDTWKVYRDESGLVKEYLTDIDVGLMTDSSFYQNAIKYFDNINKEIEITKDYLEQGQLDLPADGQNGIRRISAWYRIYVSNTAFEDLNNSGRLNLINDKGLRYNLISYYSYIDFVKILDEEYNLSLGEMDENLMRNISFHDSTQLQIPEDKVNLILNYLNKKQSYIQSYLGHRAICDQINANIRKGIDKSL